MEPPSVTDDSGANSQASVGAPPTQIVPWRGEHITALQEALLDAFDYAGLERLTLIEFSAQLDHNVSVSGRARTAVARDPASPKTNRPNQASFSAWVVTGMRFTAASISLGRS